MKFLLGTKQYMTQIFTPEGVSIPVTAIATGPVVVTQVKDAETDGYAAVQVGFGEQKESRLNKAALGHRKASGANARTLREYRPREGAAIAEAKVGERFDVSVFEVGEKVHVSATSKGKGFQGVVKRHGFAGGPRTHGQKHSERAPGSIGAQGPQRVLKGTKMAGRMGGERVTVRNLTIAAIEPEQNILYVAGAVPGRRGTLVEIRGINA